MCLCYVPMYWTRPDTAREHQWCRLQYMGTLAKHPARRFPSIPSIPSTPSNPKVHRFPVQTFVPNFGIQHDSLCSIPGRVHSVPLVTSGRFQGLIAWHL